MGNTAMGDSRRAVKREVSKGPGWQRSHPKTEMDFRALADELLFWSRKDTSVKISDFLVEKEIDPQKIHDWYQKSDYLKNAYKVAKHRIGSRRERGALNGDMDRVIVERTMPLYDDEYMAWCKWQKQKEADVAKNKATTIVVMDRVASSNLVPERKERKKE